MLKVLLSVCVVLVLGSCTYSQSQNADDMMNKDYQDYLVKKQELILFEKARTAQELKEWK